MSTDKPTFGAVDNNTIMYPLISAYYHGYKEDMGLSPERVSFANFVKLFQYFQAMAKPEVIDKLFTHEVPVGTQLSPSSVLESTDKEPSSNVTT